MRYSIDFGWWPQDMDKVTRLNAKGCRHTILIQWITRWWFQIFYIFIPTWGRFPIWLIFFKWVGNHQPANHGWWWMMLEDIWMMDYHGRWWNLIRGNLWSFLNSTFNPDYEFSPLHCLCRDQMNWHEVCFADCRSRPTVFPIQFGTSKSAWV